MGFGLPGPSRPNRPQSGGLFTTKQGQTAPPGRLEKAESAREEANLKRAHESAKRRGKTGQGEEDKDEAGPQSKKRRMIPPP